MWLDCQIATLRLHIQHHVSIRAWCAFRPTYLPHAFFMRRLKTTRATRYVKHHHSCYVEMPHTAFCSCFGLQESLKILLFDESYKLSLCCCSCYYFYCWVVTSVEFCRWAMTSVQFWHKSCEWVSNGLWCKRVILVWTLPFTTAADPQLFKAAEVNSAIPFSQVIGQHHKHIEDTHLSSNVMHHCTLCLLLYAGTQ